MVKSSKNTPFGQSGSSSPSASGSSSVYGQINYPSASGSSSVYGQINNSSGSTSSLNSSGGYKHPFASSTGESTMSANPMGLSGQSSSRASSTSRIGLSDQTNNDKVVENRSVGSNFSTNGVIYNDTPIPERWFHIVVKEDEDGEVADSEEGEVADSVGQNPDIKAIMPKIHSADCYSELPIKELAARERAEPGFCARVKDFVFGRQGYGSIKFLGETDVRELDLESLIQFNYGEVIVYMDESKKPPIGQGLNRRAEITLFNVRCIDKNSGKAYINGPKVGKYKEMLRQKAAELGAEMVAYDAQQGEWKFKFQHSS